MISVLIKRIVKIFYDEISGLKGEQSSLVLYTCHMWSTPTLLFDFISAVCVPVSANGGV